MMQHAVPIFYDACPMNRNTPSALLKTKIEMSHFTALNVYIHTYVYFEYIYTKICIHTYVLLYTLISLRQTSSTYAGSTYVKIF